MSQGWYTKIHGPGDSKQQPERELFWKFQSRRHLLPWAGAVGDGEEDGLCHTVSGQGEILIDIGQTISEIYRKWDDNKN